MPCAVHGGGIAAGVLTLAAARHWACSCANKACKCPTNHRLLKVHQIFDFPVFIKSFLTLEEDQDVGIRQYHQDGSELRNAIVFDICMYWFINYVSSISLN